MTDLRKATSWALSQGTHATAQDVADIAGCDGATALRYLRLLVGQGVVMGTRDDFRPAGGWSTWKATTPTTWVGSGGRSRGYLRAKAARERINTRAWEERRKAGTLTCTRAIPSDPLRSGAVMGAKNEARRVDMLSYQEAADRLGVSIITLRRWARTGRARPVRWAHCLVRWPAHEVDRLLAEAMAKAGYAQA
ncbi:MAG: helix-turn-helix domain-containing protein [Planctomycetes bacterium]|nr:helix-turn-helix domain-containing protein [Planctomycetota bacterium]